jgi:hypothetical protein
MKGTKVANFHHVEKSVRALIVLLIGLGGVTACSKSPTRPSETTPPAQTTCVYSVSTSTFNMSGGGGSATFTVNTGSGCGWSVTNGASFVTVSPTTAQTGPGTVTFSVGENPGDTRTGTLTIAGQTVTITQAPNDQLYGAWGGTIVKGGGCPATLPSSVEWNGTFRRTSGATNEFVISIPSVAVINQTIPVTVNGSSLLFFVPIDTLYTFNATLAADRRSLSGTFSGGSCNGTWSGTRR